MGALETFALGMGIGAHPLAACDRGDRLDRRIVLLHASRRLACASAPATIRRSPASPGRCMAAASIEMSKYLLAPAALPEDLIWHKWQSYWTWMSGFALLCWVYYGQSTLFLIDPAVMPLEPWQAAAIGIVALALGWIVYDLLCRSPLGDNEPLLAVVGFGYVVATSWVFTLFFSGRGALIHTGALMATMMTANVFFVIMPNQRKSVAALMAGQEARSEMGEDVEDALDPQQLHHAARAVPDAVEPLPDRPTPIRGSFRRSSPASSSPARWCAISTTSGISITTARRGGPGRWPRSRSSAPSASPRPLRPACAR